MFYFSHKNFWVTITQNFLQLILCLFFWIVISHCIFIDSANKFRIFVRRLPNDIFHFAISFFLICTIIFINFKSSELGLSILKVHPQTFSNSFPKITFRVPPLHEPQFSHKSTCFQASYLISSSSKISFNHFESISSDHTVQ